MISQREADNIGTFHYVSPTSPGKCYVFRRNGKTRRWKRNPERFSIPVKFGLYTYTHITEVTQNDYHAADACPQRD